MIACAKLTEVSHTKPRFTLQQDIGRYSYNDNLRMKCFMLDRAKLKP